MRAGSNPIEVQTMKKSIALAAATVATVIATAPAFAHITLLTQKAAVGGSYVVQHWGWRTACAAVGLPGIAVGLLIKLLIREPSRVQRVSKGPSRWPLRGLLRVSGVIILSSFLFIGFL